MEKIYLHLSSEFETIYKVIENENVLMSLSTSESLNNTIDLEITDPKTFNISIYPINKKSNRTLFSYTSTFKHEDNTLSSKNDYVKIYKLPENHFFIKFLPFFLSNQEISGDKLEIDNKQIKKLSYLNDLLGRAKVEVYKINDTKIKKENEYFVYTNETFEFETNSDLILLSFFESYIAKDYNTCFSYLSENYGSNLNKESLKEFFGEISSCLLVNYYDSPAVIIFHNNHASVFSANIKDGKIFDIYEIN